MSQVKAPIKNPIAKPIGKKRGETSDKKERDEMEEPVNEEQEANQESPTEEFADSPEPAEQEPVEENNLIVLKKEECEKLKYEAPLVKMLKQVEVSL